MKTKLKRAFRIWCDISNSNVKELLHDSAKKTGITYKPQDKTHSHCVLVCKFFNEADFQNFKISLGIHYRIDDDITQ